MKKKDKSSNHQNKEEAPSRVSISSNDSSVSKGSTEEVEIMTDDMPGSAAMLATQGNKRKHRFSIRNLLGGKKNEVVSPRASSNLSAATQSTSALDDFKKMANMEKLSLDAPTLDGSDSSDQALLDLQRRIAENDLNSPKSPHGLSTFKSSSQLSSVSSPNTATTMTDLSPFKLAENERIVTIEELELLKNVATNAEELKTQLETKILQLEQSLSTLKQEHETQCKKLEEEKQLLSDSLDKLRQETESKDSKISHYEELEKKLQEENSKLQQQVQEHVKMLTEKLQQQDESGKSIVESLKKNHEDTMNKIKEEYEKKIKELEIDNEGLRDDLVNLDSRASDVKKQLEKKNKDLQLLLDETKKKLEEEIETLKKESQKNKREAGQHIINSGGDDKVKEEFEKLKRWNEELNDMLSVEQQGIAALEKERDNLALQVSELQAKLEGTPKLSEDGEPLPDLGTLLKQLEDVTMEKEVLEELRQEELLDYEKVKEELTLENTNLKDELEKLKKSKSTPVVTSSQPSAATIEENGVTKTLEDILMERDVLEELRQEELLEHEKVKEDLNAEIEVLKEQIEEIKKNQSTSMNNHVSSKNDSTSQQLQQLVENLQLENSQLRESLELAKNVQKIIEKVEVEKVVEKMVPVEKIVEKVVEKIVTVSNDDDSYIKKELENLREQVDSLINQLDQSQELVREYEKKLESEHLVMEQLKKEVEKSRSLHEELKKKPFVLENSQQLSTSSAAVVAATTMIQENLVNSKTPQEDSSVRSESSTFSNQQVSVDEQATQDIKLVDKPVIASLEKDDLFKLRSKYVLYSEDGEESQTTSPLQTLPSPSTVAAVEEEPVADEEKNQDEDDIYQHELNQFEKDLDRMLVKNSINLAGKISSLKELELLCIKLKYNKTCKILDLSKNSIIDNKGLKALCEMLKVNKTITDLYLEDTQISTINPHLFDVFQHNYTVTNIIFSEDLVPDSELDKLDALLDRNETY
ncbi:hypothetical protein C9374_009347 [Naegleria lovaniensis]|uniref:Uncharacterized protein n=1 Tax=Naegleria lovaniensis TaxID=51637 RepID=A0AA88GJ34_NAELO|nr:uncharacterized protein C9374_009347 [Naegleria lovaniensis]KAG2377436.1 hypothetical protein C9374_009347 [Naegleria lovaniensis]